jgi:hypothetical protein
MRQVMRQALNVFAPLLLEALHSDDLGNRHVIGLTDGLSRHVRRSGKAPIPHVSSDPRRMSHPRHQTLNILGQLRRAQLKPCERGRVRADPLSVVHNRTWIACDAWFAVSHSELVRDPGHLPQQKGVS